MKLVTVRIRLATSAEANSGCMCAVVYLEDE